MDAVTPTDVAEWLWVMDQPMDADEAQWDAIGAAMFAEEVASMAGRPASERLAWLVHIGALAAQCPRCKTRYVETSSFEYPDMIGAVMGDTYECCGYTESFSTGLEYDAVGRVVDVR